MTESGYMSKKYILSQIDSSGHVVVRTYLDSDEMPEVFYFDVKLLLYY